MACVPKREKRGMGPSTQSLADWARMTFGFCWLCPFLPWRLPCLSLVLHLTQESINHHDMLERSVDRASCIPARLPVLVSSDLGRLEKWSSRIFLPDHQPPTTTTGTHRLRDPRPTARDQLVFGQSGVPELGLLVNDGTCRFFLARWARDGEGCAQAGSKHHLTTLLIQPLRSPPSPFSQLSAPPLGELATPSFPSVEHRQHAQQAVRIEPQHEHQQQEQHMMEISMEGDGGPAGEPIEEQHQNEQHDQHEQQQQARQDLQLQPLPVPPQQQSHDDKHHLQLPTLPPTGPSLTLLPQPVRSLTLALATAAPPVLEGFYDYPKGQEGVHHEPWIRLFGAVLEPRTDGFVPTDHACTRGVSLWTFVLRLLGVQALGWRALDESATWKSIGIRVTKLRKQQEEGSAKVKIAQWIGDHIVWRREFRSRPFDMRVPRSPPLRSAEEASAAELLPPPLRVKSTFALGITLRDPSNPDVQRALANAVDRIAPGAVPCRMGLVLAEYKRLWDTYEPLPLQPRTQAKAANAAARKKKKQAEAAAAATAAAGTMTGPAAAGTVGVAMESSQGRQQLEKQEQQGQEQEQQESEQEQQQQLYEPSGREGEGEGDEMMVVEEDREGEEEKGGVTTASATTVGVGGEGEAEEGGEAP